MVDLQNNLKPKSFNQFLIWLASSILIPGTPFFIVWVVLKFFDQNVLLSNSIHVEIFSRPDLIFVTFSAITTTFFDLINTVEVFKKTPFFYIIFIFLILSFIVSFAIYCFSFRQEILELINKSQLYKVILIPSIIIVVILIFFQIFFITKRDYS